MRFDLLCVLDVVFGPLPHEDGWEPHYGIVLEVHKERSRALVVSGSSRKIGSSALPAEVVLTEAATLACAGLRKPTRFDLATHTKWVPLQAIERLSWCGNVENCRGVRRTVATAFAAAKAEWRTKFRAVTRRRAGHH